MNTSTIGGIFGVVLLGGIAWLIVQSIGTVGHLSPIDWGVALVSLLWLLGIVTIPWNIYFQARTIVSEAEESEKRGITVESSDIAYTKRWADRALLLAVCLHAASAVGMYFLASAGISFMGYFGAGASLLLTFVRPVARGYEYVRKRLARIRQEISFPREDVVRLRADVERLEQELTSLRFQLSTDEEQSWASGIESRLTEHSAHTERLRQRLDTLQETNKLEHEKIARDAENASAKALADAAIVSHVREIVRFFKEA
ncbi:MAG: hypothetical protein EAZ92_02700 [Candidatus Kapaibacterium sp.]|nr:MAG: hypothetical protein EAZ92_02700 [Candidatus Kapabacteria bacterium]